MVRRALITTVAAGAMVAVMGFAPVAKAVDLVGSGASFPFPLYATWFKTYSGKTDGVTIEYQAKGSGAGVQDFINGITDFGASDVGMSDDEIDQVKDGVVLLPMTAGEVVLAFNVPGVTELKLPRDVYPEIFSGKVTAWNDPKIAGANEGIDLPDMPITVVRRSDSSGTTAVFTEHLAAINDVFASEVGVGKTVQWPSSDKFIAAPKNDGITAMVKQTPGSIGYIEYGYAKLTNTAYAELENAAGNFILAGDEAGKAALSSAVFDEHLRASVADPQGEDAYPIATFTWMMFYEQQEEEKAAALRDFIAWATTDGQTMASELGYIPLPDDVVAKVQEAAARIQ